jgi:hypothetical protein
MGCDLEDLRNPPPKNYPERRHHLLTQRNRILINRSIDYKSHTKLPLQPIVQGNEEYLHH